MMERQFPNLLNEEKVIELANQVVPDESITFKSNQHHHGGQFMNEGQFMHNQQMGHVQQQYANEQNQPMLYPRYCTCPYCLWMGYRYY